VTTAVVDNPPATATGFIASDWIPSTPIVRTADTEITESEAVIVTLLLLATGEVWTVNWIESWPGAIVAVAGT
jgi:hypothetical protein